MANSINEHAVRKSHRKPKRGFFSSNLRRGVTCLGVLLVVLVVSLLVINGRIKAEHQRAVDDYNANNWINVVTNPDGSKQISGCREGIDFKFVEDGTICEGVSIGGVQLGGMSYAEARDAMIASLNDSLAVMNMTVNVGNTCLVLTATDLNITTNINDVLHQAIGIGRESTSDHYENYLTRMRIANEGIDLEYEIHLDEESVSALASEISSVVDTPPVEPYITLKNRAGGGKPGTGIGGSTADVFATQTIYAPNGVAIGDLVFHNGVNGFVINQEDMLNKITEAFNNGDYTAQLTVMLEETLPTMTAEQLQQSVGEISRFSTAFQDSSQYRARNVQKAAALLNCMVMMPGVELSYNEWLGPRTEAGGWLPAAGIAGGREYVDSPGGGICQVSTTLYVALLELGPSMEIVSRRHHSIPSHYVELGLDATVSSGGPDLVWMNTNDSPLYLFSYADVNSRVVYMYVYGVIPEDGYTYRVWSETISVAEPPAPIRVAQPLWPTGYEKTVIVSRRGYTVDVFRQLYDRDGNAVGEPELLYRDIYSTVQGEIHYGTGSSDLPTPTN